MMMNEQTKRQALNMDELEQVTGGDAGSALGAATTLFLFGPIFGPWLVYLTEKNKG